MRKISRYYHTIKHLKAKQLFFRIRKRVGGRGVRAAGHLPDRLAGFTCLIEPLDLDNSYLDRFDVDEICAGSITLLHETHRIDEENWEVSSASPLWNFNLHYFEYAIALAAAWQKTGNNKYRERFMVLFTTWNQQKQISRFACEAYTASLRIPNLLASMELFGEQSFPAQFLNMFYQSIYDQYQFLLGHIEYHLLGNHYFENLKTIVLCSILFQDNTVLNQYFGKFYSELKEEVLDDGVHFERSVMYHKIIFEDLLRVVVSLRAAGKTETAVLMPYLQKMLDAVVALEKGMGRTPLFNDAGDNVAKSCDALANAADFLFGLKAQPASSFPSAGYYKFYDHSIALLLDAGDIGPAYMPGHGHCDALSFELSYQGKPLFINSGTYQYQGEYRSYFRSTAAHNTVVVSGREQSDCWGEHRVGKRITDVNAARNGQTIRAGYRSCYGDRHQRLLTLERGTLQVLDTIQCRGGPVPAESFLHLAPDYEIECHGNQTDVLLEGNLVCAILPVNCTCLLAERTHPYAPDFGLLAEAKKIVFSWNPKNGPAGYTIKFA